MASNSREGKETPGVLSFSPLVPAPDVGFWRELTRQKLDVLRLDTTVLPLHAKYEVPSPGAPEKCFFLRESFGEQLRGVLLRGELSNLNTQEEFRSFMTGGERARRVSAVCERLRCAIVSGSGLEDPVSLRPFIVVSFADLKKYHYTYTVAFPVLSPTTPWQCETKSTQEIGVSRDDLVRLSCAMRDDAALASAGVLLLVRIEDRSWNIERLANLSGETPDEDLVFVFVDSSSSTSVGWPLRNILLAVAAKRTGKLRVLAFRDVHLFSKGSAPQSRAFLLTVDGERVASALQSPEAAVAGWSKIQTVVLTQFLDSKQVAADAVDLNVKLMKWRLLPSLEPEKMQDLRFLLLGAGTLGCSVARTLMGWGVRRMTFVDSGKVSFSNPVRQSLFTHSDAVNERSKATAAREAVEAVMPNAIVRDVQMQIPMPGHPQASPQALKVVWQQLQELVAEHDVVCMLTDSRESRWLPSLLVAASQASDTPRLGLTCALGFDSFLVMRQSFKGSGSACYFCNDVTAPSDSLANRTLDQQCTVTRPGLSSLASSVAVELVASLSQHLDGFAAVGESALGQLPHQVRGFLADFRLLPTETEQSPVCTCCSPAILDRYAADGFSFIERVIADSTVLEELSGLAAMKATIREDEVFNFDEFDEHED